MPDKTPGHETHEIREIIRRTLIVALCVVLLIPTAVGVVLLFEPNGAGWLVIGGVVVAFFVGRAAINWVLLKS